MLNKDINRREMMKFTGNVSVAGLAIASVSTNATSLLLPKSDITIAESETHLVTQILQRKFKKSSQIDEKEIKIFTEQYVAFHGEDFDYRSKFNTPFDELELMKEFVMSVKFKPVS
jgi:hypothetical protein